MKFSGLACLYIKNNCGKFRCKQTSMRKVIALVFKWRIMRRSAPCAFERMTHICVIQLRRC